MQYMVHTYTYSSLTGYEPCWALTIPSTKLEYLHTLLSWVNLSMPFQNCLQYDRQWDFMIPMVICAFLVLASQINCPICLTMFLNLPNRNFNTFIAQLTFTSQDDEWESLFIDIHIDRERPDWVNPTPGWSPTSASLAHTRNQRYPQPAPHERNTETPESSTSGQSDHPDHILADTGVVIPGPPNYLGLHKHVKLELRYPIILVIRSQWESQDFPTLGNQYHVTNDIASQEQGYNTRAPNQG